MRMLITILILSGLFLCLLGNIISAGQNYLPKVDLIKGSGPEVYLLESGIKHWIPSPEIFNFFNYDRNNIKTYSDSVIGAYPQGADWDKYDDYPDGSLLRGSGPEVYLIELGKKRWIPNPEIFTESGFGWKYIINVDDDVLDDFDDGNNLNLLEKNKYPETIILKGPSQGENFRTNKCTGYLDQSGQFEPSLDKDCPILKESEYSHLKIACREFIDDLDKCEIPDYSGDYAVSSDSECTGFLNAQFNYQQCYEDHEQEADFFGDEWRVFLGKSIDIFNNDGDKVILRDASGLKVDEYSY